MSNLVILIPFNPDPDCDLDLQATTMQEFFDSIANHRLGDNVGAEIDNINIIYRLTPYACAEDDYVIIFAHGGPENSDLANNQGQVTSMADAITKLEAIEAQNTQRLLCMCCYSRMEGHIGAVWKAQYGKQETFGGNKDIATLCSNTRTQIRAVCLALSEL